MERWKPRVELTKQEETLMKRLTRVRALFGFLRKNLFSLRRRPELKSLTSTTASTRTISHPKISTLIPTRRV